MFCSLPLLRPNFNKQKKSAIRTVFKIPNIYFDFQFKIPRSRSKPDRFCSFWAYERIKQVLDTWPTSNSGSLDSFLMLNNRINFFFQNSKISSKVCSLSLKSTNILGSCLKVENIFSKQVVNHVLETSLNLISQKISSWKQLSDTCSTMINHLRKISVKLFDSILFLRIQS